MYERERGARERGKIEQLRERKKERRRREIEGAGVY